MRTAEVVDKLLQGELCIGEVLDHLDPSTTIKSPFTRPKTVTPARLSLRLTMPRPPTSGTSSIKKSVVTLRGA